MTGQDLLDRMELVNQELQLQAGEADVTKGLLALNVAQDFLESLLAAIPKVSGSGSGTVTTSASTESTAFPAGLLRIDRLQYLDPATSRPAWDLAKLNRVGGHAVSRYWPLNLLSTSGSGKPRAYWTNGTVIYWSPLPDGTNTVRYYGLVAASSITAGGTFAYPDFVAFPLATLAAKILKLGLDDPTQDLDGLAQQTLKPAIDALANLNRDGAKGLEYTTIHTE